MNNFIEKWRHRFLMCLLSCAPMLLLAKQDAFVQIKNLWSEFYRANTDSARVRVLSELSTISSNLLNNDKLADSISEIGVRIAIHSNQSYLQVLALNNYIESVEQNVYYEKAINYAKKALLLCNKPEMQVLEWRTIHNMVSIYLSRMYYDIASVQSSKEMDLARKLNRHDYIIESYIDIARSLQGQLKMIDALNVLLSAQLLSEEYNNPRLLEKCYSELAQVYSLIRIFDKAIEYKQKQQVLLLMKGHFVDSTKLMWTQNQKHTIISRYNNCLDENNVEQVIDYSIRTNNVRLKNFEFALYRKHLIESEKMSQLYRVYNIKYPNELKNLSIHDTGTYYRLKAFFMDWEHRYDSACYYFSKAEEIVNRDPNLIFRSNFYNRFGQFFERNNKRVQAIEKFTKAYQLAEADPWFGKMEFMLTASYPLSKLYGLVGDYLHAYYFAEKNSWLSKNISVISNKEKANIMWLEYQAKLDNEKRDNQLRQQRNQRNMMAGGILLLFIITLLVFRNYQNQKRLNKLLDAAKKQSEDLLLNILPHETAEELKLNGKAEAKKFEEVTVMFTDFKDFTQVSEKLSAEELVEMIHSYYSEFDKIIEKHGIEKIKIIGDSYMCVGGLPVVNKTHAIDVVSAATELQELIGKEKSRRSALGQTFFELRIGIHTGPVIAGIVGINKFAYDIWGDTVNTASRMEDSGEINKVNISGSTYERVKDKFSCTHRGKISAKHKGEIDMYFVDSSRK